MVPCLGLPSWFLNQFPSFSGIKPSNMEMPPNRNMTRILLHNSSFSQFLMSKFDSFLNLLSSFEMSNITYF